MSKLLATLMLVKHNLEHLSPQYSVCNVHRTHPVMTNEVLLNLSHGRCYLKILLTVKLLITSLAIMSPSDFHISREKYLIRYLRYRSFLHLKWTKSGKVGNICPRWLVDKKKLTVLLVKLLELNNNISTVSLIVYLR